MKSDPYYQFPLSALAFEADFKTRLKMIAVYSAVHAGRVLWKKMGGEERAATRREANLAPKPPDFNPAKDDHQAILLGARRLGVCFGDIEYFLSVYKDVTLHIYEFEENYGPDPFVRLRADLLWDVVNGGSLTYRDLAVFAALVSAIGDRPYGFVTRDLIRCRAYGYKNWDVYALEMELERPFDPEFDSQLILTEKQVRGTLDHLHERGFFVKVNPSCRTACYSFRLSLDELVAALKQRITTPAPARRAAQLASAEIRRFKQECHPPREVQSAAT